MPFSPIDAHQQQLLQRPENDCRKNQNMHHGLILPNHGQPKCSAHTCTSECTSTPALELVCNWTILGLYSRRLICDANGERWTFPGNARTRKKHPVSPGAAYRAASTSGSPCWEDEEQSSSRTPCSSRHQCLHLNIWGVVLDAMVSQTRCQQLTVMSAYAICSCISVKLRAEHFVKGPKGLEPLCVCCKMIGKGGASEFGLRTIGTLQAVLLALNVVCNSDNQNSTGLFD